MKSGLVPEFCKVDGPFEQKASCRLVYTRHSRRNTTSRGKLASISAGRLCQFFGRGPKGISGLCKLMPDRITARVLDSGSYANSCKLMQTQGPRLEFPISTCALGIAPRWFVDRGQGGYRSGVCVILSMAANNVMAYCGWTKSCTMVSCGFLGGAGFRSSTIALVAWRTTTKEVQKVHWIRIPRHSFSFSKPSLRTMKQEHMFDIRLNC